MGGVFTAQFLHQLAGVDTHRAALGAQAGGGAGVDALVLIGRFQFRGVDAGPFACLDITPDDDALARAQGQPLGRAHRLAEAALDALIHNLVGRRQWLEVLEVDLRIFAEHHVRVEDAVGVQQALELPHQLVGIAAPFQLDERCHVAPGAVLSLQRTAEFHRHQLRHVVHERLVAVHFLAAVEALGEDEVQVALQGVAEQDRFVVVVLVEQLDQAVDADGQLFHGEGHVFDDHCGAGLAHRAYRREGVLADRPELGVFLRVFSEVHLLFHREGGQGIHDLRQLLMQQ